MSHQAKLKTKIEVRDRQDLERAIDVIKRLLNAKETEEIRMYQGATRKAKGIGLRLPELPYDIDLTIDNTNHLVITFGDTWRHSQEYDQIRDKIEKAVKNEVLTSAFYDMAQQQGYYTQTMQDTDNRRELMLERI